MNGLRESSTTNGDGKTKIERVALKDRLKHFTWAQFEVTMSTGAVSVVLGQQPFSFRGLQTIGKVFFLIDLVLFAINCALILTRFMLNEQPFRTLKRSLHHPHESFFFGTFFVSISFILYSIQLYAVPSCGPWLVKALEILFWLYIGLVLLVVIFQYHVLFDREELPVKETMPAWVLPAYPFLVSGPLAAVLLYSQPASSSTSILVGGIVCQGLGFFLAFLMYSLYFQRLISRQLPDPAKRPGMYVAVGPAAYTSNALVALGYQAHYHLPEDFLGIHSVPVGDLWYAFGVGAGCFLWLIAFWFFAVATVSVLMSWKTMHFTINYWSFIYPNGALTSALIYIGTTINSTGIKAVASGMTILLVAAWLVVVVLHLRAIWKGDILWPGMDEDEEDIEGHGHDEVKEHEA